MSPRKATQVDLDLDVAMAFYHSIGNWAKAVETGDTPEAELQLRKLDVLGRKMAEGAAFCNRFAETDCKLGAIEMLGCLRDYLSVLTQVGPSQTHRFDER